MTQERQRDRFSNSLVICNKCVSPYPEMCERYFCTLCEMGFTAHPTCKENPGGHLLPFIE